MIKPCIELGLPECAACYLTTKKKFHLQCAITVYHSIFENALKRGLVVSALLTLWSSDEAPFISKVIETYFPEHSKQLRAIQLLS